MTPQEFVDAIRANKLTLVLVRAAGGYVVLDSRGARMAFSDGRSHERDPVVAVADTLAERARREDAAEESALKNIVRAMSTGIHPRPTETEDGSLSWDVYAKDNSKVTDGSFPSAEAALREFAAQRRR